MASDQHGPSAESRRPFTVEFVRVYAGMFIGNTGPRGLGFTVYRLVEYSLGEATTGYGRSAIPIGVATDAADVPETALAGVALADIPAGVVVPPGVPVDADRAYDSDPLRADLAGGGFTLVAPHRKSRKRPPTADGRRLRRYKRRWIVERTFAWVHSYRRVVTRFERRVDLYDGFVHLACAFSRHSRIVSSVADEPATARTSERISKMASIRRVIRPPPSLCRSGPDQCLGGLG